MPDQRSVATPGFRAATFNASLNRAAEGALIADFGITLDNVEGMTFGPTLANGRRTLVLVADDNFSAAQVTQFLAFAVEPLIA